MFYQLIICLTEMFLGEGKVKFLEKILGNKKAIKDYGK